MINLLPDAYKVEIRAGRVNVLLVRYIFLMLGGVILISGLLVGMYITLNVSAGNASNRLKENEARERNFAQTKKEAEAFRSDLTIAKSILDHDVRYSNLIYKISSAVPKGVILDSLNVDSQSLGASIVLNASATSYDNALALKHKFETRTDLFSDVHFQDVSYNKDGGNPPYLYQTSLSVVINKDAL